MDDKDTIANGNLINIQFAKPIGGMTIEGIDLFHVKHY